MRGGEALVCVGCGTQVMAHEFVKALDVDLESGETESETIEEVAVAAEDNNTFCVIPAVVVVGCLLVVLTIVIIVAAT
mgnify:CR=1 FL=1